MAVALLRWTGTILLFAVVAACLATVLVPPFLDRIYYRGAESGHYDGARFFNPDNAADTLRPPGGGGRGGFLARRILGDGARPAWPESVAVTPAEVPARVTGERMLATWVGHATVFVQANGLNILTDPVWSDRAGPFGVGPRRVAAPGIAFDRLPKIDVVLVSHNHYDHLDLATLKRLWERDRPLIVTSLGNDAVIANAGVPARALDWGGRIALPNGAEVAVTRNHHWGSRWFADRNRALWSSFVVRLPGGNIFFAGDTGPGDLRWPEEAAALGPVRLALVPIGAFRFAPGMMSTASHIGPGEAAIVFDRLGAGFGIPIHWGTFRLSDEGYDTPPKLLTLVNRCLGIGQPGWPRRFEPQGIGRTVAVPTLAETRDVRPPPTLTAPPPTIEAAQACIASQEARALP